MKKLLSVLLALVMTFSCMATLVSAEDVVITISKQPTLDDMSVEVDLENATYQWYEGTLADEPGVIDDWVATPDDTTVYDEENNAWVGVVNSAGYVFFCEIELNAGDSLILDFDADVSSCTLSETNSPQSVSGIENEDGSYTVTAFSDNTFKIFARFDGAIENSKKSVVIYGKVYEYTAIEGENSNTLSKIEDGKAYYCEIKSGDASVKSDIVIAEQYVSKQPTASDPSVEASIPANVTSYQWYVESSEYKNGFITDKNANALYADELAKLFADAPSSMSVRFNRERSSFEENGWKPTVMIMRSAIMAAMPSNRYAAMYCSVKLPAESTLSVKFYGEMDVIAVLALNINTQTETSLIYDEELGVYSETIPTEGEYIIAALSATDPSNIYMTATGDALEYTAIEGETTDTLSALEYGNSYRCGITMKDGSELISNAFVADHAIIRQPTANNPSVDVTFEEDASYQWCDVTYSKIAIDDEMTDYNYGTYDSETEEWSGDSWTTGTYEDYTEYGLDFFDMYLKKGQIITVTLSNPELISPDNEFRFSADENDAYDQYVNPNEDGSYTVVIPGDDIYSAYCYVTNTDVTVKFEILEPVYTPIEGQTEKELTEYSENSEYAVIVTYENGDELISETFEMIRTFTKQPTPNDVSVEVTFAESVKSYQWYEAIVADIEITDENAYPAYWGGEPSYYDKENKCWVPSLYGTDTDDDGKTIYDYDIFAIDVVIGDVIAITPDGAILNEYVQIEADNVTEVDPDVTGPEQFWKYENGTYYFISPLTGTVLFYFQTHKEDITVTAQKLDVFTIGNAIEGATDKAFAPTKAGKYLCIVTYNDDFELVSDIVEAEAATKAYALGDINMDEKVNQYDYILAKRAHFETITLNDNQKLLGDMDENGKNNQYDYILIKRIHFKNYSTDKTVDIPLS